MQHLCHPKIYLYSCIFFFALSLSQPILDLSFFPSKLPHCNCHIATTWKKDGREFEGEKWIRWISFYLIEICEIMWGKMPAEDVWALSPWSISVLNVLSFDVLTRALLSRRQLPARLVIVLALFMTWNKVLSSKTISNAMRNNYLATLPETFSENCKRSGSSTLLISLSSWNHKVGLFHLYAYKKLILLDEIIMS